MINLYYANLVKDFFKSYLFQKPEYLSLIEENKIDNISFLPLLGNIMKYIEKQNPTRLIYRELVSELFLKYQDGELDLFVIPEGFSLESEEDLNWIYQALFYHLLESLKSYIGIITTSVWDELRRRIYSKSPIIISPFIDKIIEAQKPETQQMLLNLKELLNIDNLEQQMSKFFADNFGVHTGETLIQEYIRDFDLLLSYFFRPWGQESHGEKTFNVLQRLKEQLGERYNPLFAPLDVTLRNKFVHRNYFIDNESKEIVYYAYNKEEKKNDICYITIDQLKQYVIQLKFIRINFFLIALTTLYKKLGEKSKHFILFNALWNPIDKNNIVQNLFGIDLSLTLVVKESTLLEKNILGLRQLINLKQGVLTAPSQEFNREKTISEFWTKIFESPELAKEHEVIFAFFLYTISEHPKPDSFAGCVDIYIKNAVENGYKVEMRQLFQEVVWAVCGALVSPDSYPASQIDLKKEGINKSIKILKRMQYSKYIRNITLMAVFKENISEIDTLNYLITILKEEGKAIRGDQLIKKIREQFKPDWPQPDFIKAIDCLRFAEKLGLIYLEEHGELMVKLR